MSTMRILESNLKYNEETDFLNIIKKNYNVCARHTRKKMGLCELTDKKYEEDSLVMINLKGFRYINPHPMCGQLIYHPDNQHLLKYAEAYKEFDFKMITKHNLQGWYINFKRSNGDIQQVTIEGNNPITFCRMRIDGEYVSIPGLQLTYFNKSNEDECDTDYRLTKFVPLKDVPVEGIINLNKDIFTDDFVLKIGYQEHDWYLKKEREEWKQYISNALEGVKHEFYTY